MKNGEEFSMLVDRLGRIAHGLQYATGLNPAQWEALRYLSRANRRSSTPSALAAYLGSTKGTVSQTLNALEAKGCITRARVAGDRRSVSLEVTERGRALLENDPLWRLDEASGGLSEGERRAMVSGMNRLIREVCASQGNSPFGVCTDCCHLRSPVADDGACAAACTCKLTGEPLDGERQQLLCINFEAAS